MPAALAVGGGFARKPGDLAKDPIKTDRRQRAGGLRRVPPPGFSGRGCLHENRGFQPVPAGGARRSGCRMPGQHTRLAAIIAVVLGLPRLPGALQPVERQRAAAVTGQRGDLCCRECEELSPLSGRPDRSVGPACPVGWQAAPQWGNDASESVRSARGQFLLPTGRYFGRGQVVSSGQLSYYLLGSRRTVGSDRHPQHFQR